MKKSLANSPEKAGACGEISPHWFWPMLVTIIIASMVLRLWDLDADPFPFHLGGVEVDEGYWIHNARLSALNIPLQDDLVHAEASGPLASSLIRLSFELGGVSFTSARLPSAISGVVLVLMMTLFAYTAWGRNHALLTAYLTGFAEVLVIYSRLAVVESISTAGLGAALMLLVHTTKRFPMLAGTAASFALLTKITSLYFFPGLLAIIWIMESGKTRWIALYRFVLGFLPPTSVWVWADWLPNAEKYYTMIKAAASSFDVAYSVRAKLTTVMFNSFFGLASTAVLVSIAVMVLMDWKRLGKTLHALLFFIGIYLVCFFFSPDHSARRCIPLMVPLILIAVPTTLGNFSVPSLTKGIAAVLSWTVVSLAVWKGRLWSPGIFDNSVVNRTYCLFLMICVGCLLWVWINRDVADCIRRKVLVTVAFVLLLPAVVGLTYRTHSLYETARGLAQHVGRGAFVTGPMAHTLSLEGEFYPLFYAPKYRGLSAVNSRFELTQIGYQLYAPKIANWGTIGLGFARKPELLATYKLFPRSSNAFKWQIELYRLDPTNGESVSAAR